MKNSRIQSYFSIGYQVLAICLTFFFLSEEVSLPYNYMYYDPPKIQIGWLKFDPTDSTIVDIDSTNYNYHGTFSQPVSKLPKTGVSSFFCYLGVRSMERGISRFSSGGSWWIADITSYTPTQLNLIFVAKTDTVSFAFATVNYFLFDQSYTTQKLIMTAKYYSPSPWTTNSADKNGIVQPFVNINLPVTLSHTNYHIFTSLLKLSFAGNDNNALPIGVTFLKSFPVTPPLNYIRMDIQMRYLHMYDFYFAILLIDKALCNYDRTKDLIFWKLPNNNNSVTIISSPYVSNFFAFNNDQKTFFIGISDFDVQSFKYSVVKSLANDYYIQKTIDGVGNRINLEGFTVYGFMKGCPYSTFMINDCKPCTKYCTLCDLRPAMECLGCETNFVLSSDNLTCQCQAPRYIISDICEDFNALGLQNCIFAERLASGTIKCNLCDLSKKFVLQNGVCVCMDGYHDRDNNRVCVDKCGDGKIMTDQCDDGNTQNNDGCSNKCKLQSGFKCTSIPPPTKCSSLLYLKYKISSITKKQNYNKAIIVLILDNIVSLPFAFSQQQFTPAQQHIILNITLKSTTIFTVTQYTQFSISQNHQITLEFEYLFTIEDLNATFYINYEHTEYTNYVQELKFTMKGGNMPLKIVENISTYEKISSGMMAAVVINILFLVIGTLTPKFIGLESILTLHLIFYSQLLIYDLSKWPGGFVFLRYLKLTTGYSDLFQLTNLNPISTIGKKLSNLQFKKTFIQNFNSSFLILTFWILLLIGFSLLRSRKQSQMNIYIRQKRQQNKKNNEAVHAIYMYKLSELKPYLKLNEIVFWITNQMAMWLLMPLISSLASEFLIENEYLIPVNLTYFEQCLLYVRAIVFILTLFCIFIVGLNNFANIWLSLKSLKKIYQRPEQLWYKRIFFLYLIVMSIVIFGFHNRFFLGYIYTSAIALFLHVVFIIILLFIHPYRQSLRVHSFTLIFNQMIYLGFLIVINLINYLDKLNEIVILMLAYFVSFCCACSIIMTGVRLYYEIRYGEELEIQIQEEREKEKQLKKEKEQEELNRERRFLQKLALAKMTSIQLAREQNVYLYQNQIKQMCKLDLLEWLEKQDWQQKQKQRYYYKKFYEKPLKWMKSNDQKKYLEKVQQQKRARQELQQKKQQLKKNENFLQMTIKLKQEYLAKKQSQEKSKKKKISRLNKNPEYAMRLMDENNTYKFIQEEYNIKK